MLIINNVHNSNINSNNNTGIGRPPETRQQKIALMLQQLLEKIPPAAFNRQVRNFFMLHIASLKTIPPGFEDFTLEVLAMMELLDEEEDREERK